MVDDFVKIDTSGRKTQAPIVAVDIAGPVAELIGDGINPTVYTIENITLLASGWVLVNGLYEYTYSNAFINVRSVVGVTTHIESVNIVRLAMLVNAGRSYNGYLKLYAYNLPVGDIIVTMNITGEGYQGAIPNLADLPERNYESLDNKPTLFQLPTQTGNAGKVLSTDGTSPSWVTASGGGGITIANAGFNPTSINCALGNFIKILISSNFAFNLTNVAIGVEYIFMITRNISPTNNLTIAIPNTNYDIRPADSVPATYVLNRTSRREISLIYDGTYRYWAIGNEMMGVA